MRLHLDTLVVGAYRDQSYGQNQGSVYIFEKFAGFWTQTTQLRGSDLSKDDAMGGAVAIHGDLILTNAADDDRGVDSGLTLSFLS